MGLYDEPENALKAAVKLVGDLTKASRNQGFAEFLIDFPLLSGAITSENLLSERDGQPINYLIRDDGDDTAEMNKFLRSVGAKEVPSGSTVTVLLGVEHATSVWCCDDPDAGFTYEVGGVTVGEFPDPKNKATYGTVKGDPVPPDDCMNPSLRALVHSHNVGAITVRPDGSISGTIVNGELSSQDKMREAFWEVPNFAVLEDPKDGSYTTDPPLPDD